MRRSKLLALIASLGNVHVIEMRDIRLPDILIVPDHSDRQPKGNKRKRRHRGFHIPHNK